MQRNSAKSAFRTSLPLVVAAASATLACGIATAQVTPQSNAQSTPDALNQSSIEEVIVTANKREGRLDKVGSTVAVLGSQQLAENKIESLADVAAAIPGLSYSSSEQ